MMLITDPQVKAILVNVFGGIVNCATIGKIIIVFKSRDILILFHFFTANGIVNASRNMKLSVPLVVRIEGNSLYFSNFFNFNSIF